MIGRARRLLLVEDNDDIRESLTRLLESKGYVVDAARHGQEALQKLRQNGPPCLAIMDLIMPVMDGWQLRRELLKDEKFAAVPVVIVSGVANLQKASSVDSVAKLQKPVSLPKLYHILDEHCSPCLD